MGKRRTYTVRDVGLGLDPPPAQLTRAESHDKIRSADYWLSSPPLYSTQRGESESIYNAKHRSRQQCCVPLGCAHLLLCFIG